ncbi:flagellar basal body-associated FliL family protein [Palleronia sp. KMU-117]|uniref:flagellar basal body-associated FliL family protein n=1 Tax=Palleronia sp. KMU-117 TaxID=3434108 RepID=UPI003D757C56
MGHVLAVVIVLLGLGAGIGAGMLLAPPKEEARACDAVPEEDCTPEDGAVPSGPPPEPGALPSPAPGEAFDYVRLNNQFVIPVISGDSVAALVVISLTLEVTSGTNAAVFDREPRLRDAFLQVLFDFAYAGGFDGPFTQSSNLAALRRGLREAGQTVVGPDVRDVLIVDIVRQEV